MLEIGILGYKSNLIGEWDPEIIHKGVPGSEEAVIYASMELVSRDFNVTVFMNTPKNSKWNNTNPRWLKEDDFYSSNKNFDILILWRRFDFIRVKHRTKKLYLWPHDIFRFNFSIEGLDGILSLSNYHTRQINFNKVIAGNGVLLKQFSNPINYKNPYSMGYYSNYSRGLEILLNIWPEIKENFPEATLDICYGRNSWNTISDEKLKSIIEKIELYKDKGITEHGMISQIKLAEIMQNNSIWAYPCISEETFCITAVKAQLAGCIPVTTRISALNETVHIEAPSINIIKDNSYIDVYKKLLLETLKRAGETDTRNERLKYIEFAKQFSWVNVINKWINFFKI